MRGFLLSLCCILSTASTSAQCAQSTNVSSFSHNGKKYEIVREFRSWTAAASCAVSRGGYLVEINNVAEQNAVYSAIMSAGIASNYAPVSDGGGASYIWIGATDKNVEGTWLWDGNNTNSGINFYNGQGIAGSNNGSLVTGQYANWGGSPNFNEPDDFSSNQDAAAIAVSSWPWGSAGQWNDIAITNSIYYVIEYDCSNTTGNLIESHCDSYTAPSGKVLTNSGLVQDTIANAAGCDSIISIFLTINQTRRDTAIVALCFDSVPVFGNNVKTAGFYSDTTFGTGQQCDSIHTINLIDVVVRQRLDRILCIGDSINVNGNFVKSDTMYLDSNTQSCEVDSIVIQFITIDTSSSIRNDSIIGVFYPNAQYNLLNCDNNTVINSGNTGSFGLNTQGNYAIIITVGNCSDTTSCLLYNASNIDEVTDNYKFEIYPNPIQNVLNINTSYEQNFNIVLYDNSGRIVLEENNITKQYLMDLSHLTNGLYHIEIKNVNGTSLKSEKVIISK